MPNSARTAASTGPTFRLARMTRAFRKRRSQCRAWRVKPAETGYEGSLIRSEGLGAASELPQHVFENAAVAVVLQLLRRVDPDQGAEFLGGAAGRCHAHGDFLAARESFREDVGEPRDVVALAAREAQ